MIEDELHRAIAEVAVAVEEHDALRAGRDEVGEVGARARRRQPRRGRRVGDVVGIDASQSIVNGAAFAGSASP